MPRRSRASRASSSSRRASSSSPRRRFRGAITVTGPADAEVAGVDAEAVVTPPLSEAKLKDFELTVHTQEPLFQAKIDTYTYLRQDMPRATSVQEVFATVANCFELWAEVLKTVGAPAPPTAPKATDFATREIMRLVLQVYDDQHPPIQNLYRRMWPHLKDEQRWSRLTRVVDHFWDAMTYVLTQGVSPRQINALLHPKVA